MRYLSSMLAFGVLFFTLNLAPVRADAPPQKPAVSFSPAVIDFGLVPSHERPTQLVTVTLDRSVFSPENLPTLQPTRFSNGVDVSLFAQFNTPNTIRVVYQVTVHAERDGPIRDTLVLTADKGITDVQPISLTSGSATLAVLGAVIPSLTASPSALDFGNVLLGKSKSMRMNIGYFGSGMVQEYTAAEKHDLAKFAAEFPPNTPGLANTAVTSSSPLVMVQYLTELGFDTSVWQTWIVTFKSRLPLGRNWAQLQFKTQAGYYVTVPVTAEVVAPVKPEPHTPKKN